MRIKSFVERLTLNFLLEKAVQDLPPIPKLKYLGQWFVSLAGKAANS